MTPDAREDLERAKGLIGEMRSYFSPTDHSDGFDLSEDDVALIESVVKRVEDAESLVRQYQLVIDREDAAIVEDVQRLESKIDALKAENAREHENFLSVHRDNMALVLRVAELKAENAACLKKWIQARADCGNLWIRIEAQAKALEEVMDA